MYVVYNVAWQSEDMLLNKYMLHWLICPWFVAFYVFLVLQVQGPEEKEKDASEGHKEA